MTESTSGSLSTESEVKSSVSIYDGPKGQDDPGLPLVLMSAYQDEQARHQQKVLPNLPSHRYRFSVWHDLSSISVTGDQLKAPRVRAGPPEKEEFFYKIRDKNSKRIHHTFKGKERKVYTDKSENWENTVLCNLNYQDLGHDYQKENFMRVLRRLIRAEELNLIDDELQDLKSLSFPRCTHLNLTSNYIVSFKKLPKLPVIRSLILEQNNIENLDGLESLKKTPIEYLSLRGNPVSFTLNYRYRVFQMLPQLKYLDNCKKLEEDDERTPSYSKGGEENTKTCVIS